MGSSVCTGGPSGCASYSFRVVNFTSRGMARAETSEERKSSFLSSASFRSATSYASFRSFKSIKSNKSLNSRASFKSVVSRDDSSNYFSCHDSISTKTGIVNEGYVDNLSFYSVNDSEVPSIAAVAPNPRQRSISNCLVEAPSDIIAKELENDPDELKVGKATKYISCIAVIIAATAVAGSATVTSLVPSLTPWMVLVYRSILQLVTSLPLMLGTRSNLLGPAGYRWRLYLTGLLTSFLLLSLYLSISSLPARIVAPILMTTPVVTVLMSWLVLREHLGVYRLLTTSLLVAGFILLTRPPPLFPADPPDHLQYSIAQYNLYGYPAQFQSGDTLDTLPLIAAMVAPFIAAVLVVITRQCQAVHFSVLLFWSALGSLLMGCIGLYSLGREEVGGGREGREIPGDINEVVPFQPRVTSIEIFEGPTEWLVATLVAFLGIFVNVVILKVLKYLQPGKVMLLKAAELVAGYVLHLCVTGQGSHAVLRWLDMGGAVCVGLAVAFTGLEDFVVDTKRWRWF